MVTVTNLVRSRILDDMAGATGTLGEGQVYVDNMGLSVTMSNFFNSALRTLWRTLRTTVGPMLIADNYILSGITPVNGPLGTAVPDPSIQVSIGFAGYFDGTNLNSQLTLPGDCLNVIRCWERLNSSNLDFSDMGEPGALSGVNQRESFGEFEWRQDKIFLRGALTTRDLRIRYWQKPLDIYGPSVNLATTFIPVIDCEEALCDQIVLQIADRSAPERVPMAMQRAKDSMAPFINEQVRRQQGQEYSPRAFGSESGPYLGWPL